MEKSKLALHVIRALQLICGVIILAMAIQDYEIVDDHLDFCKKNAKHAGFQKSDCDDAVGHAPIALAFGGFVGAFGILDALVGVVGIFLSAAPWLGLLGVDVLAAIFFVAGGVNSAVVRGHSGIITAKNVAGVDSSTLKTKYDTATAFMFIGFLATLATMVLVFMIRGTAIKHSAV